MKEKILGFIFAVLAIVLILYGCTKPEAPAGRGLLTLNLTDKPAANYEEVFITFTEVSVHWAEGLDNETGGDEDMGDNDTDNITVGPGGWIIVSSQEQGFDLLQLQNGQFDLLAQAQLPAGTYTQIRLKITDGLDINDEPKTYVMVDGEKRPLVVPSGTKSGLKLTHPFTITADNETVLYLDFNAEKSVKQTGSGTYHLKPTIRVLTAVP